MANLTIIPDTHAGIQTLFDLQDHYLLVENDEDPGKLHLYGPGNEYVVTFDLPASHLRLERT